MNDLSATAAPARQYHPILASTLALVVSLAACSGPVDAPATEAQTPTAPSQEAPALPVNGAFVGRVWISTTPGSALGSIIVFLPDRTVLTGSCVETFRLTRWGVAGEHIRWIENTIPVEAKVTMPSRNGLRLHITGTDRAQSYVAADAPYGCPSTPR